MTKRGSRSLPHTCTHRAVWYCTLTSFHAHSHTSHTHIKHASRILTHVGGLGGGWLCVFLSFKPGASEGHCGTEFWCVACGTGNGTTHLAHEREIENTQAVSACRLTDDRLEYGQKLRQEAYYTFYLFAQFVTDRRPSMVGYSIGQS